MRELLPRFRRILFVELLLLPSMAAIGQTPPTALPPPAPNAEASSPTPAPLPAPAHDKRAELAELLRLAQQRLEANPSDPNATQQVAHYQSMLNVLAQQEVVDQQIRDIQARKSELDQQLKLPVAVERLDPAEKSFAALDRLKDELAEEATRGSLVEDRLAVAKAALEKSQRSLGECEVKRRQAQEAYDVGKSSSNAAELAQALELAKQAALSASETVELRNREAQREALLADVQQLAVQLRRDQIARLAPIVTFAPDDLAEQLAQIKKQEDSAERSLERAQNSLHEVSIQVDQTQKQLDAETGDRTLLTEKLEAHRRQREKLTDEIDSLRQRLGRLAQRRVAWNRRFQVATANAFPGTSAKKDTPSWSQLKEWQSETRDTLDELAAQLRNQIFLVRTLRSSLSSITKKVDAAKQEAAKTTAEQNGADSVLPWLEMQRSQIDAALRTQESNLMSIESSRRVHEKLLEELGRGVLALTPATLALGAWHQLEQIWNFEIASLSDKPITVKKLVTGIVLFAAGWLCSRFLSSLFANRVLGRFRLSKDGTAAIRTLVFYLLLMIAALAALRTINVPLTAFTILGGALAIGVGFGSQALINNFIGGLIMLAERPVRLGERITFGPHDGVVEEVGFRCTKLRTQTDHLVTIPNSTLVNESIENVARRRTIRRTMNVTITYDTPREKIAAAVQAIRDLLEEKEIRERIHPIVGFEEFPPRVYFNDYNPESLNILVVYWYAPSDDWWAYLEHCERVNYRIMEEFDRLGVEFAFPSRTVYLVNQESSAAAGPASRGSSVSHPSEPFPALRSAG